jgi:hypothetical protein
MEPRTLFQRLLPHLVFVFGLFLITSAYFLPAWQKKELQLQDVRQGNAATIELRKYKQETGQFPNWTNAIFSGMPGYLIAHDYPNTYVGNAAAAVLRIFPRPIDVVFMQMVGMYILLIVLLGRGRVSDETGTPPLSGWVRGWVGAMGAVAYGLASWNLITVEAGHISKILALAYAPGMLAGLVLCLRGRYWSGAAITALFTCLNISANHVQITYYLFLCMGLYILIEGIRSVRSAQVRQLVVGLAIFGFTVGIGMASFSKRLLVLNQYSKETIRGKSELTAKTTATPTKGRPGEAAETSNRAKPTDGLDKEYAFQYSYGIGEVFTMLVPNLYGGLAGQGGLDAKSETYKALSGLTQDADSLIGQIPTYWGTTNGPAYCGAIIVFLFVLSLFINRLSVRWFMLGGVLLTLALAMGKNLAWFNETLFDFLPYFNKFRAVTMTLTMTPIFLAGGAALALQTLLTERPSFRDIQRPFLISLGLTGGAALLFALLGGALFDFKSPNDEAMFGTQAVDLLRALQEDRASLLKTDAFRAFFVIALAAGLIWLFLQKKLKAGLMLPLLFLIQTTDVFQLDRRFINRESFIPRATVDSAFEETPADTQVLQDSLAKSLLSYRVFDNSNPGAFMSDNRASYFHKSIGGYSAAKLQRYQELITYAFPANSDNVLNMLNTRYIIAADLDSTGRPVGPAQAQRNPNALGNAWFVQTVKQVANADDEMAAMKTLDPRTTAVVDQRYAEQLRGLGTLSGAGSIALTAYTPDKLTYLSNTPTEQVATFSEVFYRGNDDWKAYVDGKETPHFRANYVLRGLRVPAGKHTIEFRFEPPVIALGNTLDLIFNLLLIVVVAAGTWFGLRKV